MVSLWGLTYYDAEAVREPHKEPWRSNGKIEGLNSVVADDKLVRNCLRQGGKPREYNEAGRNIRNVWQISTAPYPDAHFATFPPQLAETCIKAGCPEGGTVLDPFGGSGTTGLVADRLKRDAILIELNPEYAAMAKRRIKGDAPMFTEVTTQHRQDVTCE